MSSPYKNIFTLQNRRFLSDDVVDSLRAAICTGQLQPGEQLREEALAKSLGISRGPIREALNQLEHEGLVVTQENRRRFIARLSREDLDEVFSLRMALELLATKNAVHLGGPAEFDDLQCVVDKMVEYSNTTMTAKQAADTDIEFHAALCRASKNKRLYHYWTELQPQIYILLLSRNVANEDFRDYAVGKHQSIVDAIRARNEELAVSLMQAHLQASYNRIVVSYELSGVNDENKLKSLITRSISDGIDRG